MSCNCKNGTGKCSCGGKCKKHEPGHVCKCSAKKVKTTTSVKASRKR